MRRPLKRQSLEKNGHRRVERKTKRSYLTRRGSFVVLPTGYGKSVLSLISKIILICLHLAT